MWRKIVAGLALFATLTSAADAGSGRVRAPQKLLLLGNAVSASAPAPLNFLRVVTTMNGGSSTGGLAASGTANTFAFYTPFEIAQDCSKIVLSFNAWGLNNSGESITPNAITIIDAAIDTGTVTSAAAFTTNGTTVAGGAVDFQSDAISPPAGRSKFTKGEIYGLKLKVSVPATTGVMPAAINGPGSSVANWQSLRYDPALTTVSSTATPGVYTSTGTAPGTVTQQYRPIFLGFPYVDQLSVIATGDSEIAALTDTCTTCINGNGYFQRGLTDLDGVSNPRPAINFSLSGDGTSAFNGTNTRWQQYIKYVNVGFNGLGTNDISGGSSFLGTTALQLGIVQLFRQGGLVRVIRPELFPNTTSTDSFATVANQTGQAGWTPGAVAPQTITWFSTKLNDAIYTGVMSASDLRDATVPTSWQANGTNFFATPDGKHPSVAYHIIHGTTFRSFLSTFPTTNPAPSVLPPVLNPFDKSPNITLSNGNLTATNTTTATQSDIRITTPVVLADPKKYFEIHIDNSTGVGVLLALLGGDLSTSNNANILTYNTNGGVFFNGQISPGLPSYATGNTVSIAIDMLNLRLASRINGGNWNGNVANDPAVGFIDLSGAGRFSTVNAVYPGIGIGSLTGAVTMIFSGFSFAVPTGYSAITGGGVTFLLNRDIDPASNDNEPVWLARVA